MRLRIRDLLWLAVLLALGFAWIAYSRSLWIEKPMVKQDTPPPEEAISEYRELLNRLQ